MPPSTFFTWVQETTFAGVPLWSLCVALAAAVATYAAILVVQQLCTEEFVERRFRLTADAADELLTVPERFIHL